MPMAKVKKTTPIVWRQRYTIANQNQQQMFKKFAGWYDKLYAHINTKDYAAWRSKVYLPIISNKVWAMIAKLTSLNPGFETGLYGDALNDPSMQDAAEKMQWVLEHDWNNPLFDEPMPDKLFSPLVDAVATGTGLAKVPWVPVNKKRFEHAEDEYGELDFTKDTVIEKADGFNDLIAQDITEVYIAPGAKSLQRAAWVILGDYATYDELRQVNDDCGFEFYKNLDKVKDLKATNDANAQYKKARERLTAEVDNIAADKTVAQFRRYECYEKSTGYIYTYAAGQTGSGDSDEWVELNCRPNPYWHGKYPLVPFYVRKRPHSFWGQGVFEDTERMLSAANDIFNHYMDNLNVSLDGMVMLPDSEESNYIVQPGGEFRYTSEKPEQFKFPEPNPNQLTTVMNMLNGVVEEATISNYATGNPNSQLDKTQGTAAGIVAIQNAAGDKIGAMKQSFSTSLKEVGYMWMMNRQQFTTSPLTLMGQVDNRPAPVEISPRDIQAPMTLRINDSSMEPENKQQRVANFQAYLQQLTQMQQAAFSQAQQTRYAVPPVYFNYGSLIEDYSQLMGQANFDKILVGNDEVMQAMQNAQTPWLQPNERWTADLDELYGSEAGQLLQRNGITPDPARAQQVPMSRDGTPINTGDKIAQAQQLGQAAEQSQAAGQTAQDAAMLEAQGHVPPGTAQQFGQLPQVASQPTPQPAPQPVGPVR